MFFGMEKTARKSKVEVFQSSRKRKASSKDKIENLKIVQALVQDFYCARTL